ncbi:atp23_ustma ame: full=mitochondrial inner membrane protease atp23 [Ceraceosorus bombacis]|uniref:Mitochondrial inner membrane protease ATP23 n=1 Tax=Ceraceosorus bombacis TaxID=401625 RepID=A0A0N7LAB5_9BASI|nr:atp23_ustma ame: full=mitochondrial inner membrane protease atp23 [Ceraceosorus bombacis]
MSGATEPSRNREDLPAGFEAWLGACRSVMTASSPCASTSRLKADDAEESDKRCARFSNSSLNAAFPFRSSIESTAPAPSAAKEHTFAEVLDKHGAVTLDPWSQEKETDRMRKDREKVEQWRDELFKSSPIVRFMVKHLSIVGCAPESQRPGHIPIVLAHCSEATAGGFSPHLTRKEESALMICANHINSKTHLEHTFAHEMIHWWDHCRFKVDWNDLRHHACTEVRAASLSGDCSFWRQLAAPGFNFVKRHQRCTRRRAILSVEAHPRCTSREEAERAVDEVFSSCFKDTRPFDEIY